MTQEEKIQEIDDELAMLREPWMTAKGTKKEAWMKQINKKLDERNAIKKGTTKTNYASDPT